MSIFTFPNRVAKDCDEYICLSVCLFVCARITQKLCYQSSPNFLCMLPMAIGWPFSSTSRAQATEQLASSVGAQAAKSTWHRPGKGVPVNSGHLRAYVSSHRLWLWPSCHHGWCGNLCLKEVRHTDAKILQCLVQFIRIWLWEPGRIVYYCIVFSVCGLGSCPLVSITYSNLWYVTDTL